MRLLSRIEGKSDGNPTYVIGDPIKYVHKGNEKSLVVWWHYQFNYLSHPYGEIISN